MKIVLRLRRPNPSRVKLVSVFVVLVLLIVVGVAIGQQQQSGGTAVTQSGNWSVRLQDGSGNSISSTSGALNVNLSSGSIANTAFGINAGTNLIGTILPKTASCGTTPYDSGPTNLPSSLTSLTTTATCIEAVYCASLDSSTSHALTVTDQSTACNSGTCNLVPPSFLLTALAQVRFPLGFVRAVGGIKWNTDATNKVTCWIEGVQ